MQMAALPLLDPERARQDRIALQNHFVKKRDYVLKRLVRVSSYFEKVKMS